MLGGHQSTSAHDAPRLLTNQEKGLGVLGIVGKVALIQEEKYNCEALACYSIWEDIRSPG